MSRLRFTSSRQGSDALCRNWGIVFTSVFLVSRIRHLTSVLSPFEAEMMLKVEGPNYVIIGSRFRLVFQNVIFHSHVARLKLWGEAMPVCPARQWFSDG